MLEYLDNLDIDQLRLVREESDKRIKKAEESPKKILWIVTNGMTNASWHREENYKDALLSLAKVLTSDTTKLWAFEDLINERGPVSIFERSKPEIVARYYNEVEYEEWFK